MSQAILDQLLFHIEEIEVRSLVWGYVDGSLSSHDISQLAQDIAPDENPEDLIEDLIDRRLLFEVRDDGLRSRFAEGIRLLARLRQLFPRREWDTAPRLVSDFRVDHRRRRYPRRDIDSAVVLQQFQTEQLLNPLQQQLWQALTEMTSTKPLKLARFQVDAVRRIFNGGNDSGCIVTAGTGSGKTLCFYLPALLELSNLVRADEYWTKALAIYPRTELLKDQFSEAYRLARRLDTSLQQAKRRPLQLGALFGATPNQANEQALQNAGWLRRGKHYICPFLPCPRCDGDLLWRQEDLVVKREQLCCERPGCGGKVSADQIRLTRTSLLETPPDLLFTTTEMLNRRLADTQWRKVLGAGQPASHRPRLLLLDEVHTYSGVSGAQVALVLRRWRYAVGGPVRWVGLSATLLEAEKFFATLTGLRGRVLEITPSVNEFEEEGAEYQVLLRGDPVAQASLLSTSIQAAMLLGRLLDPSNQGRSEGRYGNRLFVFTDDLDVTNRLFDNLRDAEAYDIFGRPDGRRQPLAALRQAGHQENRLRDQDGQRWAICERIARPLIERLRVGRTTSKDVGVTAGSDVIVATAALEVGYNDPGVGAVMQHKAPRNFAAYLQRKGRAGRHRQMRPWMVTVLSDYGRDRLAYQGYEQLFDPVIPPQSLPTGNLYLLKTQAVFALLDWLTVRLPSHARVWLWDLLSSPQKSENSYQGNLIKHILQDLASLMRDDQKVLSDFRQHLQGALAISPDTVNALLWEPPRSILLEVVPTLTRRLYRRWQLAFPHKDGLKLDFHTRWHPLPDFVPAALFGELGLPDVQIILPPATRNDEETQEGLPLVQALNQLVPGRVTRRFAHQRGGLNHWLPVDWTQPEQCIAISQLAEQHEYVGDFGPQALPVFRPWQVRLQTIRQSEVSPTSNARWNWNSEFIIRGEGLELPPPSSTVWAELLQGLDCYQHTFNAAVSVRRYAASGEANIRRLEPDGFTEYEVGLTLVTDTGSPAAIGFEQEVDGLALTYALPAIDELATMSMPPDLLAVSRAAFFRYRLLTDDVLGANANPFLVDWLYQIYLSALVAEAVQANVPLSDAQIQLHQSNPAGRFAEVMTAIFNFQGLDDDSEMDEEVRPTREGRLQQRLRQLLADPGILARLTELTAALWASDPQAWGQWLRQRLHETLAQAWLDACLRCAPREAATDNLLVDPLPSGSEGTGCIWITETTPGGAGVIQALARVYAEEPRRLFQATEAALAPGDQELAGVALRRFLTLVCDDPEVEQATGHLRAAQSHSQREQARHPLFDLLQQKHGLAIGHAFSIALHARLLRPGMDSTAYRLLHELFEWWDQLQTRLGVLVESRVFCYLAIQHSTFGPRVRALLNHSGARPLSDTVQALAGLLWPPSGEIRQLRLQSLHPFRSSFTTDPHLVRILLLHDRTPEVLLEDSDWLAALHRALIENGSCRLRCRPESLTVLRRMLIELLARPIAVGHLHLFPAVERFEREPDALIMVLSLRELL